MDSIGDDLTNYAFCFGLAYGQYIVQKQPWFLYAGCFVLALQVLASGLLYRRMIKLGTGDLLAIPEAVGQFDSNTFTGRCIGGIRQIFKRDSFVFILALLTAFQMPALAFCLFGVGTLIMFVGVVMNEYRLGQLDANPIV